ncbi:hypothetical protein P8625_06855 [Tenacibaculum tangerinum]|uniref:Uncharacterized protein n=1 Tax=Tenacibaculum tangerinum TaxID=3038772 RepID=A0ABY8L643_9FLAO|nr:hypothetical protein [Tenacibaculum tangerinum]WGH76855.1 hypothetical protein P8625_06855 [Tenacibaculum tangerinum]
MPKAEQTKINGGIAIACYSHADCPRHMGCCKDSPYVGLCMEGEDYRMYCDN